MSMNASKALGFNDPKFDLNNSEKLKKNQIMHRNPPGLTLFQKIQIFFFKKNTNVLSIVT